MDVSRREDRGILECHDLALNADYSPVFIFRIRRKIPDKRSFLGKGNVDVLAGYCQSIQPDVLIVNDELSVSMIANLEKACQCRVVDRSELILELFHKRATSREGKLQVEAAALQLQLTRQVRRWTHLERQRSVRGLRGGPGERQIELDRRVLRERLRLNKVRLSKVRRHRALTREGRLRGHDPLVAIVGYTNAGKSTLFNRITSADVLCQNKLFATLDTSMRKRYFPELGQVIFVDTVGFIHQLPTVLIEAFKATLEEICYADLIVHVMDGSDEDCAAKFEDTNEVIRAISAEDVPRLLVINKIDQCRDGQSKSVFLKGVDPLGVQWISAKTGEGIDQLAQIISRRLQVIKKLVSE
jgi:GTPase